MLVIVGNIISVFVAYVVKKLKEPTVSQKERFILVYTYYLSFFNACILLLILNSNFVESKIPILKNWINKGKSSDWDSNWYKVMGPPLVNLVVINEIVAALLSIVEFLIWKI